METKTKKWFSSHEAAKIIQKDWTHKKLCDFLTERRFLKSANVKLESFSSGEKIKYSKEGEKRKNIYKLEFEIEKSFINVLIADYNKLVKEYYNEKRFKIKMFKRTDSFEVICESLKAMRLIITNDRMMRELLFEKD